MELSSIKDAFDRVTKKQKLSSSKTQEMFDQIRQEIEGVLDKMQSADNTDQVLDYKTVLNELKTSLLGQLESTQKELNVALSKYLIGITWLRNLKDSSAIFWDNHTTVR
ncbi:hypothetical protein TSUD_131160 [Trifolium subterraneum]|uniref:Uncharacterized protein n=1 Tax=Trifolium subterraneum TaxID=3900 RepID=A0A2Z6NDD1_TRISU|nr:hypothetical protein TSUD_131160 [Trifolium subterraneum]